MLKKEIIKIFLFVLICIPAKVYSQIDPDLAIEDQIEEEKKREVIEIKPLVKLWYLDGYGAFKDSARLDTTLDFYHMYNPIYDDAVSVSYLGNYGTPYQNNNFFKRDSEFDFFFLQSRAAYLLNPASVKFFNTRTPYTRLDFSQSEHRTRKNETRFNVLHSQNINPFLNVTFRYDQAKSEGQYSNQQSKNNFVSLYSNYNRDKLSIHGGFISNSIKNAENGGLTYDSLLLSNAETELLNVNLENVHSEYGNMYVFATGEYRVGKTIEKEEESDEFRPVVGFIYSFEYENNKKQFIDDTTNTFFINDYYGNDFVVDLVRFRKIRNVFQIKQYENSERKTSFGKRAFIGQDFIKASSPGMLINDSTLSRVTNRYTNVYAGGGIFRQTGNFWKWNFDGKIYLLGRNIGQTEISGVISKPFTLLKDSLTDITIRGKIENSVPDYFQETYYSKHIQWDNDFKMEQRMTVQGNFVSPKRRLEFGANYAIINNFIYNDTLGIPSQTGKELLILSAYLDKDFSWRNLHLRTRLLWQKASNQQYIHLPDFSAFGTAYYKFVLAKVLFAQIGVDTRYNTAWYADAYDPETGLFYLQNDKKYGNFPYIDAFANLRLKRTRIFFKMMNIGTEFIDEEYMTVPHYPMLRRTYRIGVSWAFYD